VVCSFLRDASSCPTRAKEVNASADSLLSYPLPCALSPPDLSKALAVAHPMVSRLQ